MLRRIESTGGRSSSSSSASQNHVACPVWPSAPVADYYCNFDAASSSISTVSSSSSSIRNIGSDRHSSNHSVSGVSGVGSRSGEFGSGSSITSEDETSLAEALLFLEESYAAAHTKSPSEPAVCSSAATQVARVISSNDFGVGSDSLNCSSNPTESLTDSSSSKRTLGKRVAPDTIDSQYDSPRKKPAPRRPKNNDTREERNAREKDRSLAISSKIQEIQALLAAGGAFDPQHHRVTKNKVLSEAIKYIRLLQHRVVSLDHERSKLLQINQHHAASEFNTLKTTGAHEGTWSLAIPPPEANGHIHDHSYDTRSIVSDISTCSKEPIAGILPTPSVERSDYRSIFQACPVGMAIASLGGQFVDCNPVFCQIAKSTKNEACSTTLFLLIHKEDLQDTFVSLSGLVSSVENLLDPSNTKPCIVRGRLQQDHCLRIEVIAGSDGTAHSFCVTFVTPPLVVKSQGRLQQNMRARQRGRSRLNIVGYQFSHLYH